MIAKKDEQKESVEFNCGEDREGISVQTEDIEISLRFQSPSVAIQEKHDVSPHRKIVTVNSMSRRESFEIPQVDAARSSREVRQKHMILAINHHPD